MESQTAIGSWVRRDDGGVKVRGRARYTGDIAIPDLLHVRLVLSPYAHAKITRIDTSAARAMPGVVAVLTAGDLPLVEPEGLTRSRDPLARDRVFFEGQPVVAVVAESEAIAMDAVTEVLVDYDEIEPAVDPMTTLGDDRERVHDSEALGIREDAGAHTTAHGHTEALPRPANATSAQRYKRGDIEQGFAEAASIVEREYVTSWVYQAYLEPQSSMAVPDGAGNLTVYSSTQGSFSTRNEVASGLGIPPQRVKLVAAEVGGAFGAKYALLDPLVAAIAWKLDRPARLVYTRSEDFLASTPAPGTVLQVKTGATKDGRLTALQAKVVVDTGAFPGETAGIVSLLLGGTYRFPNLQIDAYEVLTNKPGAGAYRAPGAPQACFAIEGQIEEMARELGLDPMEFRLKNVTEEGDLMPDGPPWPRVGSRAVLETLRDHAAWQKRGENGPGEGVGIALGGWPAGTQPASATCRLNPDGSFSFTVGSVDIAGTNVGMALLGAQTLGVSPDKIEIVEADTDSAPFAGASGGSKITYTVGSAIIKAAEDAKRQIFALAAEMLEAAEQDLELAGGDAPILGDGRDAHADSAPGFVAHLARVRVDEDTGLVTVLDYVAVQDVGKIINPAGIQGQVYGGVTQGIGWALMEGLYYDDSGHLRTGSFVDYAMPSALEVPGIESILVEVPSPDGPFGARGVGEPPVVAGAAAIANAVYDATGVRPTQLPIMAEKLVEEFQSRRQAGRGERSAH